MSMPRVVAFRAFDPAAVRLRTIEDDNQTSDDSDGQPSDDPRRRRVDGHRSQHRYQSHDERYQPFMSDAVRHDDRAPRRPGPAVQSPCRFEWPLVGYRRGTPLNPVRQQNQPEDAIPRRDTAAMPPPSHLGTSWMRACRNRRPSRDLASLFGCAAALMAAPEDGGRPSDGVRIAERAEDATVGFRVPVALRVGSVPAVLVGTPSILHRRLSPRRSVSGVSA